MFFPLYLNPQHTYLKRTRNNQIGNFDFNPSFVRQRRRFVHEPDSINRTVVTVKLKLLTPAVGRFKHLVQNHFHLPLLFLRVILSFYFSFHSDSSQYTVSPCLTLNTQYSRINFI